MILQLRSGASADRRKLVCFFQMAALCRDAATPIAGDVAAAALPGQFAFWQGQTLNQRMTGLRGFINEFVTTP